DDAGGGSQGLARRSGERVGDQQQRNDRAEGKGEDHFAPDLLPGKCHFTIDGFVAHPASEGRNRARAVPRGGQAKALIRRVSNQRPLARRLEAYKFSKAATIFVYGAFHNVAPARSDSRRVGAALGLIAIEACGRAGSLPSPRLAPVGAATSQPCWSPRPTRTRP